MTDDRAGSSTPGIWALYGHVVPDDGDERFGGCWLSVLVGPFTAPPPDRMPSDEPDGAGAAPLLGTWDHRPSAAEQRAVLPPEASDPQDTHPDTCPPHDPDGLSCRTCGAALPTF